MMDMLKKRKPESLLVYCLFCFFGIGSWIAVNSIWAEISILVNTCPECYKLPAVLIVIIQIANIGPLLYAVVKYSFHHLKLQSYQLHLEIGTIFLLILIGFLACIFLSLFWNETLTVFNDVHSVSLFILTFFLSLVDCTSSVLFIPFMRRFPAEYLSALYIGEGLSGLLPSLFALSQGHVNNSIVCSGNYTGHESLGIRFSPNIFFIFIGGMMLLCGISFLAITTVPAVYKHQLKLNANIQNKEPTDDNMQHKVCKEDDSSNGVLDSVDDRPNEELISLLQNDKLHFSLGNIRAILWANAPVYVCLCALSFLTNGALNAISSFIFLPYGNNLYHIAINLSLMANPLMTIFFAIFPSKSDVITVVTTVVVCVMGIYIVVSAQSPLPAFQELLLQKILVVSFDFHPNSPQSVVGVEGCKSCFLLQGFQGIHITLGPIKFLILNKCGVASYINIFVQIG